MDDYGLKVHVEQTKRELNQINYRVNRGSMYALRAVGRRLKQVAKRNTPKDSGTLRDSIGTLKRLRGNATIGWTNMVGPMPRNKATKSGRNTTDVKFYRRKEEERAHYMRDAFDQVAPEIRLIHEKAWSQAIRGR